MEGLQRHCVKGWLLITAGNGRGLLIQAFSRWNVYVNCREGGALMVWYSGFVWQGRYLQGQRRRALALLRNMTREMRTSLGFNMLDRTGRLAQKGHHWHMWVYVGRVG